MSSPAPRLPRYPDLQDCTFADLGKCRVQTCRFSLLADRPRIKDWDPEDLEDLTQALPSTCSIEMASLGPMLLDEIATLMGLPRPVIEQLETSAARKLRRMRDLRRAHWDGH
jgi:hypothetical protein